MTGAEIAQWVVRGVLALVFVGMGVNHFRPGPARTMARIIPPSLRREGILSPRHLVWFTGVCEIAGGIGILLPATRTAAAIGLVAFLIAVWPANAYAAEHPERFGRVAIPFWPRFAGQLGVILLVVLAAV
jgi:uncharacterized membrane protein